jgi:hypothetical protein
MVWGGKDIWWGDGRSMWLSDEHEYGRMERKRSKKDGLTVWGRIWEREGCEWWNDEW